MQLKLIIKHSLFRGIHTHCLLLRICIHADKTWCRHTWRFSPLFSTSIYHPDIPLWRASKGWILPHDRSLYKFALHNQMVSVKLWQQWAGFRAKYLFKTNFPSRRISANMTCCCPQKLPLSSQGIHQKFIHFRLKHFNIDSFRPSGFDTWIGLNRSSLCAVGPIYHTLAARLLWSNFDLKIMVLRLRQCKYPDRRKLICIFCFTTRF